MITLLLLFGLLCDLQLCLAETTEPTTTFDRQVIAVLEDQPDLIEAAVFLYMKHPSTTDIAIWDAGKFYRYNPETHLPTSQVIENEYEGNHRIQVVGHGQVQGSGGQVTVTMSGLTAQELVERVSKLIKKPADGVTEINKISLAGCELAPARQENTPSYDAKVQYLKDTIRYLTEGKIDTVVTARSLLVAVSPSGQKLLGELQNDEIVWKSKERKSHYRWRASKRNKTHYLGAICD